MHGPEECQFVVDTFARVEELLKFPRLCIKIGVMDEERRTSANLKEVLRCARERGFSRDSFGQIFHNSYGASMFVQLLPKYNMSMENNYSEKNRLRRARERVCFINTGFLDRTGDEIHTSFTKGIMMPKDEIKKSVFIPVYERRNVQIGI